MGKDEREANSPSFFNVTEVETLIGYLSKLKQTQGKKGVPKLTSKDIGIIAPYRKQVSRHFGFISIQTGNCHFPLWPVASCFADTVPHLHPSSGPM